MEKIWLKSYPPGVPAEIRYDEYQSIGELFDASVKKFAERPAYHNMGKTISFAELDRLAQNFGAWLQAKGLAKGARVAIMMPNVLQYPVALFGTLRAGCVVVNVNPLYTARELEHQLKDSGAEAIVILENFAITLQQVAARTQLKHIVVASLGDMLGLKGAIVNFVVRNVKKMVPAYELPGALRFNDVVAEGARHELKRVEVGLEDIAFLQYTGGTTGVSKGAMLLHRNIVANLEMVYWWQKPLLGDQAQVIITALPLYHIFSLTVNCLTHEDGRLQRADHQSARHPGLREGTRQAQVHHHHRRQHALQRAAEPSGFRQAGFQPAQALDRRRHGGAEGGRGALAAGHRPGAARGLRPHRDFARRLRNPLDLKEYNGAIGLPMPSTEIAIRDDDGKARGIGEAGEICVRGPQVMKGYWQRPEETAKVMSPDGFFATGDIAMMDAQGFVRIVDRKKDMILVSGFNVYPNEVEDVVAKLPGVLECAVIGVPDEQSGEAVKLFVVKKDPALTEEDVRKHCETKLTGYKRPKYVEFRTELPKTNVGKILRRALRDEVAAQKKAA